MSVPFNNKINFEIHSHPNQHLSGKDFPLVGWKFVKLVRLGNTTRERRGGKRGVRGEPGGK